MKPKVIVIVGPTASGKSSLSVRLAKKIKGEIISADSRQVYKGLNLGTGKITTKEMDGVPHYLLSVANPKRQFSVAEYKNLANVALRDIVTRKKYPIIVGGTGFYIDTLLGDITLPLVPPNLKLRKRLDKMGAQELFLLLKKLDPRRAKTIDNKNKVRLIRAIEIAKKLGRVPKQINKPKDFDVLYIGLCLPDTTLRRYIHQRLLKRVKDGMITEVKTLHKNGLSWKRMEELGLEYKFLALYLQNKVPKKEMLKDLETAIWQYSRRQMTWFKRNKEIRWFDPSKNSFYGKVETTVKKFLI